MNRKNISHKTTQETIDDINFTEIESEYRITVHSKCVKSTTSEEAIELIKDQHERQIIKEIYGSCNPFGKNEYMIFKGEFGFTAIRNDFKNINESPMGVGFSGVDALIDLIKKVDSEDVYDDTHKKVFK